jgi:hypothetical protein
MRIARANVAALALVSNWDKANAKTRFHLLAIPPWARAWKYLGYCRIDLKDNSAEANPAAP